MAQIKSNYTYAFETKHHTLKIEFSKAIPEDIPKFCKIMQDEAIFKEDKETPEIAETILSFKNVTRVEITRKETKFGFVYTKTL